MTGNGQTVYESIADSFRQRIASGEITPGQKIDTVRLLAVQWEVNPNTVQRAMAALEEEALVCSRGTAGRFVTKDAQQVEALRRRLLRQELDRFSTRVKALGYRMDQALWLLEEEQEAR